MNVIRDVLNKIIWDKREKIEDYSIAFVHRAGGNVQEKRISMTKVLKIGPGFFVYEGESGEVRIPFHRITKIVNERTGIIVWSRKHERKRVF